MMVSAVDLGSSDAASPVAGIPTELQVNMTGRGPANGAYEYSNTGDVQQSQQQQQHPPFTQEDVHAGGASFHPQPQPYPSQQQQQAQYTNQQQQQPTAQQFAINTPWKLGSTDGVYAMNVAIRKQQQDAASHTFETIQQQTKQASSGAMSSSAVNKDARLSPLLEDGAPPTTSPTSQSQTPNKNNLSGPAGPGTGGATTTANTASPKNGSANAGGGGVMIGGNASSAASNGGDAPVGFTNPEAAALIYAVQAQQSLYQDLLFRQPCGAVEAVLAAACEAMHFDIAEMWLRTGPKTHQLTNSHLRPTALEDSVRRDLVDVYYGDKSNERTHRLSPALCKRAKEASDVVWVTGHTPHGADALRASISNVRTAVAVPVCHEASNTNITIIFFSIRRILVRPTSVEFLVHMALAAGVSSINSLSQKGHLDRVPLHGFATDDEMASAQNHRVATSLSQSEHQPSGYTPPPSIAIRHQRQERTSVTGARLDLAWRQLTNVEYLTDGGNSWIHTAVLNGQPVVVKTLKPECQDVSIAMNEIEGELAVHARLNHPHIVGLIGAGTTSKGVRFVVLERLDGGTLTQMLGYDTRIRDRRRRFWKRKQFAFVDVLRIARSIVEAMAYCHEDAVPGCVVLHRDLKPDNIGFTLDGSVKIIDFGLAKLIENATVDSNETYAMSGETGSLRYMAPEVAECLPYNWAVDVYSFGIILWEMNAGKKPFEGLNREMFYERVVHGGERPPLRSKWPDELKSLMKECWDADTSKRPRFRDILRRLDGMMDHEKGGPGGKKSLQKRLTGMIDRHSTWF